MSSGKYFIHMQELVYVCFLDQYMMDTRVRRQNPTVTLQMYEVYNELVKDLLQVPGGGASYCDLAESANRGVYVKVDNSNLLMHSFTTKWI